MQFPSSPPLKPLDLTGRPPFAGGGAAVPTRLSPADLAGVIARPKPGTLAADGADPAAARHAQLVRQTQQWVGQTFFGTLMKQMRDSPFRSDLFEGGRGGQAFASMYDQKLIEHMSRGAGQNLVRAVVRKLEAGSDAAAAYRKQSKEVTPTRETGESESRRRLNAAAAAMPPRQPGRGRAAQDAAANSFKDVRIHVAPGR